MMDSNALLDAVKARYNLPSDYALARQVLKVDPMSLKDMRERGLSEERALQIAVLLEIEPGEVLASIRAERAKSPAVKAAWRKVAESMRSTLGVVAVLIALLLATAPDASGSTIYATTGHCILCQMLRRALEALARFLHTFSSMRRGIFALPLLLAACGQPVDGDNHGWGWQYDAQAADGLRVRYADDSTPRVDDLDVVYQAVATCMNASLPHGPLLIFAPGILATTDVAGFGFLDTGTFVLDNAYTDLAAPGGQFTLRHELVHYILDQIGFPRDLNQAHDSPYFSACVVP